MTHQDQEIGSAQPAAKAGFSRRGLLRSAGGIGIAGVAAGMLIDTTTGVAAAATTTPAASHAPAAAPPWAPPAAAAGRGGVPWKGGGRPAGAPTRARPAPGPRPPGQ